MSEPERIITGETDATDDLEDLFETGGDAPQRLIGDPYVDPGRLADFVAAMRERRGRAAVSGA